MDQANQFTPANNLPNNTPPSAQIPSVFPDEKKPKKIGPIIAVLVAILIIVIVSLYLVASKTSRGDTDYQSDLNTNPISTDIISTDETPQEINPISNTADDIDSLQADLEQAISGLDSQNI
jgi:hypothetical protein